MWNYKWTSNINTWMSISQSALKLVLLGSKPGGNHQVWACQIRSGRLLKLFQLRSCEKFLDFTHCHSKLCTPIGWKVRVMTYIEAKIWVSFDSVRLGGWLCFLLLISLSVVFFLCQSFRIIIRIASLSFPSTSWCLTDFSWCHSRCD